MNIKQLIERLKLFDSDLKARFALEVIEEELQKEENKEAYLYLAYQLRHKDCLNNEDFIRYILEDNPELNHVRLTMLVIEERSSFLGDLYDGNSSSQDLAIICKYLEGNNEKR